MKKERKVEPKQVEPKRCEVCGEERYKMFPNTLKEAKANGDDGYWNEYREGICNMHGIPNLAFKNICKECFLLYGENELKKRKRDEKKKLLEKMNSNQIV